jgi:predicted transcriptional regulator
MVKPQPSDLELQILGVLWAAGPSTVRDVLANMPDGKARAYTTILSCLQVMEKKGLVAHKREGQGYLYRPVVQKERVLGSLVRQLLRNVFGGRPSAALQYFIAESDCTSEEIKQLRRLINEAESQHPRADQRPRRRKRDE